MSRGNLHSLLDMIKDHSVSDPGNSNRRIGSSQSPKNQMLTIFHHLVHVDCNASLLRDTHFLGYGTLYLYLEMAVTAIASLGGHNLLARRSRKEFDRRENG